MRLSLFIKKLQIIQASRLPDFDVEFADGEPVRRVVTAKNDKGKHVVVITDREEGESYD